MDAKLKSCLILLLFVPTILFSQTSWNCEILPPEHKVELDAKSGAKTIFVTSNPASDVNLYFHDRCFLHNNKIMLFNSDRFGSQEIMAYLLDTGELVRLDSEHDMKSATPYASIKGDRLYVVRDKVIYEWKLDIVTTGKTSIKVTEKKLTEYPQNYKQLTGLSENSDASLLAFAYGNENEAFISTYNFATGEVALAGQVDFNIGHLQFHKQRPDVLSFCRNYGSDRAPKDKNEPAHVRLWFLNINTHVPVPAFEQVPGELVTHECWWVNDQITFIGSFNSDDSSEDGHVKVLDLKTGEIRVIGPGSWWEGGTPSEIARENWWHASGSPDGKWVVADNWHGIVALFNARTTERKILATGHRTYGKGAHPHAGWDLNGTMVEFSSNKYGNADVCIAVVPEGWGY